MKNAVTVTTPSDREIVIRRVFNAPREAVWDTMTRPPELLKRRCSARPAGRWSVARTTLARAENSAGCCAPPTATT